MSSVQVSQPPALQQQQQQQQQQHISHFFNHISVAQQQQMQRRSVSPNLMQNEYQIENDKSINNNNNIHNSNTNNTNNNNNNQSRSTTVSPHSVQSTQSSPSNSQPNSPITSSPSPKRGALNAHTFSPLSHDSQQQQQIEQQHLQKSQQQHLMATLAPLPPPPSLMATPPTLPLSMPQTVGVTHGSAQRLYDTFQPVGHAALTLNGYSISRLPPLATAILSQSQPASPTQASNQPATPMSQPPIVAQTSSLLTTNPTTLPQSQPKKSAFCIDSLLAKNQSAGNDNESAQTTPILSGVRSAPSFFPMPTDDRLAALQCMAAQQSAGGGLDMSQHAALSLGRMSEQEALQRIRESRVYGTPSPDGMSR